MPNSNKVLTEKDLTMLSEMLHYEQWACKKSKLYADTLTDPSLQSLASTLSQNHEERFKTLLGLVR